MTDPNGQTIIGYQIINIFAEDRLGILYESSNGATRASALLRIVHPELAQGKSFQDEFIKQANRLRGLRHPGIVPVLDDNYRDATLYMVMKWVSDLTLEAYLKRELVNTRALDYKVVTPIARQLAAALHYAYQQGVQHYSLSPSTIFITQTVSDVPVASIFDFGFRPIIDLFGLTSIDAVVDSVALQYLAPEQFGSTTGDTGDTRTDIYALGCILYELFTGRPPFSPQNLKEAARLHKEVAPSRPSSQIANLPTEVTTELDKIILRCLAKNPNDRYQNAGELERALSNFENIRPVPPPPVVDYLVITSDSKTIQSLEIKKNSLLIGRKLEGQSKADVTLDGAKISREHARLERLESGKYQITDLGADNGTWINNVRLEANMPQPLALDTKVRINAYELHVHRGDAQLPVRPDLPGGATLLGDEPKAVARPAPLPVTPIAHERPVAQPASIASPPPPTRLPVQIVPVVPAPVSESSMDDGYVDISKQINIIVTPQFLEITTDTAATLKVEIINNSQQVDHFPLEIVGIPPEWIQLPEKLKLFPGKQQSREIRILAPSRSTSVAAIYPIEVRTKGEDHATEYREYAKADGQIKVKPFYRFDVELHPKVLRVTNRARLEITNRGNEATSYQFTPSDAEEALRFDFGPESDLVVPEGKSGHKSIRLIPKKRPIVGMGRSIGFKIKASNANLSDPKPVDGTFIIWPYIPLPLLLFLALLIALLALIPFDQDNLSTAREISSLFSSCHLNPFKVDTDGDGINDDMETPMANACLTSTPAPPTASLTPTATLTPTPHPTSSFQSDVPACKDAPPSSNLFGFRTGKVSGTKLLATPPSPANAIRESYSTNADGKVIIGKIIVQDGIKFYVQPEEVFSINSTTSMCAFTEDGGKELRWWNITYAGVTGWMADGDSKDNPIVDGVDPIQPPTPSA